jgi:hypothetical protein
MRYVYFNAQKTFYIKRILMIITLLKKAFITQVITTLIFCSTQAMHHPKYTHLFAHLHDGSITQQALMMLSCEQREALNVLSCNYEPKKIAIYILAGHIVDIAQKKYGWTDINLAQLKKGYGAYLANLNKQMITGTPEIQVIDELTAKARTFQALFIIKQRFPTIIFNKDAYAQTYFANLSNSKLLHPRFIGINSKEEFVQQYLKKLAETEQRTPPLSNKSEKSEKIEEREDQKSLI